MCVFRSIIPDSPEHRARGVAFPERPELFQFYEIENLAPRGATSFRSCRRLYAPSHGAHRSKCRAPRSVMHVSQTCHTVT